MPFMSQKVKSALNTLGNILITLFFGWLLFGHFIDGVPTDSAEGMASGYFNCDPQCQDKISLDGGELDPDNDIIIFAVRKYLSCKYYTSMGWSIRNYWRTRWIYERAYQKHLPDEMISRDGIPVIGYDWDSYLPMKEIARKAECPDRLDGNLDKRLWDTPVRPDKFRVRLFEEKDWATDHIKYDEWKKTH